MFQIISERYEQLLKRKFRIRQPEQMPNLTIDVAHGVKARRILHWYDETSRSKDGKPIACCFGHLHGKGFVVELDDDRIVLVGKTCAKNDFGFDFDAIREDFEAEADLQFEVSRFLAIRKALPAATAEIKAMSSDTGFDTFWQTLPRKFTEATRKLGTCVR